MMIIVSLMLSMSRHSLWKNVDGIVMTLSNSTSGSVMISSSTSNSLSLKSVTLFFSAFWILMPSSLVVAESMYRVMVSWLPLVLTSLNMDAMLMPRVKLPVQRNSSKASDLSRMYTRAQRAPSRVSSLTPVLSMRRLTS